MANFNAYKITNLGIDTGGELNTSGAYALTLTVTGITDVTFPTSGTLATTANITTHAAVQTGVHGLAITAGKTLTVQDDVTITGALGSAAYTATTAYEASGAVSTHAALITGVHGLVITAGKTFTLTNSLTLSGTDTSTLNIGTGGTLGTAAYGTLGTGANNVVQLTAASKLPAVDGSLLTNISGTGLLIVEGSGYGLNNSSVGRGTVGTKAVSLEYSGSGSTYGATGSYSFCGGRLNASSNLGSFVGGGDSNISSGSKSGVVCGTVNVASSEGSFVGGGQVNTASGLYSTIPGGERAIADKYGEYARSSGQFGSNGDCQQGNVQARISTSAVDEAELFLNGSSEQFTLSDGDAYTCEITVLGKQADGSCGTAKYRALIKREGSTTSLTSTVQTLETWFGDANINTPAWAITADDTNDALAIKVTPANTTATRWTALLEYVKINY